MTEESSGEPERGPAAAVVGAMTEFFADREAVARAVVARLPQGVPRHRAESALGGLDGSRLALDAAIGGARAVGELFTAARDVGRELARVEESIWNALGSMSRQAVRAGKAVPA